MPAYDCPSCGKSHPRGCRGHVDECMACKWRGDNHVGKPCHKCGGEVILRPCRRAPAKGGTVCRGPGSHGGEAPQTKASNAQRRELERLDGQVAQLLDQLAIDDNAPLPERLLDAVRITGRMMHVYRHLVDGLDLRPEIEEIVVGDGIKKGGQIGTRLIARNDALYGPDHQGDAKPHVLVNELHRWTEAHAKAVGLAIDKNVAEQLVEIERDQVRLLFTALQSVTEGLVAAFALAGVADRRALDAIVSAQWPGIVRAAVEPLEVREV